MNHQPVRIFQEDSHGELFYLLDKAIRTYRQLAHEQLATQGMDITVDQWLVLKALHENPDRSQQELAAAVFKDHASFTRIVELLVKKGYLNREMHPADRRRFLLQLTKKGTSLLKDIQPVIEQNRKIALNGLSKSSLADLQEMLRHIVDNCKDQ